MIGDRIVRAAWDSRHGGRVVAVLVVAALSAGLGGCVAAPAGEDGGSGAPAGLDNLNAVLWMQTAVEYRANSLQAYKWAGRVLDDALADPEWTALLGQTAGFEDLPPAVILDIDETVLDNSYYEARLTLDNEVYSDDTWDAWVLQGAATAIPGAVEFTSLASSRGVKVFYVTNRRAHLEAATRTNLAAVGVALDESTDTLLLRGERPEWESSDKTPRWESIGASHRILMMFGDNMGDFTAAAEGTVAERQAFADAHADYWGTKWMTLANPTYGSFIGAVLDNDFSLPVVRQAEIKKQALDPRR